MAAYGKCNNYKGGHPCGCQRFKPVLGDTETCRACGCDESFHEQRELPGTVNAETMAGAGSSRLSVSAETNEVAAAQEGQPDMEQKQPGSAGTETLLDAPADEQGNEEPAAKRAKTSSETTAKGSSKAGVYDELLEAFQQKYPAAEYGDFEMRLVKLDWKVHCKSCNKDLAPGNPKFKLKNIEVHVEGQRKEGKESEHMAAFKKAEERAAVKAEEEKRRAEDVMGKRKALLQKYRGEGTPPFLNSSTLQPGVFIPEPSELPIAKIGMKESNSEGFHCFYIQLTARKNTSTHWAFPYAAVS